MNQIKLELRLQETGGHLTRPITLEQPVTITDLVFASRHLATQTTAAYQDMYFVLRLNGAVIKKWSAVSEPPEVFFYDKNLDCINDVLDTL